MPEPTPKAAQTRKSRKSFWLRQIYTYAGQPAIAGVDAMAWYSGGAMVGGLLLPLLTRRWHHDKVLIAIFAAGLVVTAGLGLVLAFPAPVHLGFSFLCGVFVSGAFFMLYPPAVRFYPTDIRSTGVGAALRGPLLKPVAITVTLTALPIDSSVTMP